MIVSSLCIGALFVFWCDDPKKTVTRGWCQTEKAIELQIRKSGRKPISRNSRRADKRNHLLRKRVFNQRCTNEPSR